MVHLPALPGSPSCTSTPQNIIQKALEEAKLYEDSGISAIMIENMHDRPYLNSKAGHEISTIMAIIGHEIKQKTKLTCGIQILAAANVQAIAVAYSAGMDFIRAEGFVFGHLADEGFINSDAGELLRFRKQIGANQILIFNDIKKKHSSHAITSDLSIDEIAQASEFFLSDGIIITGKATGYEPDLDEVKIVKKSTNLPVLIGSGINKQNIAKYYGFADAFIIGSYFKEQGNWINPPDQKRIKEFLSLIQLFTH